MSERSLTTASAARLESAARELSGQAEALATFSKRFGASMQAAIAELPKHAESARTAMRAFLDGIRAVSRNGR